MDTNYRYDLIALFDRVRHTLLSAGPGEESRDYVGRLYAGVVLPLYTANLVDPIAEDIQAEVRAANREVDDSYTKAMNIASICYRRLRELP